MIIRGSLEELRNGETEKINKERERTGRSERDRSR